MLGERLLSYKRSYKSSETGFSSGRCSFHPEHPFKCSHATGQGSMGFHLKGNFTIRKAYKIVVANSMAIRMEVTSNGDDHITFWRRIWSLNVSNKIKSFAW